MAPTTEDPKDPRLTHGPDNQPGPQAPVYLVLSAAERKKGFIRPVRRTYIHQYTPDGQRIPDVITSQEYRDLNIQGCGAATTMSQEIAETYARDPKFYGSTYCMGCQRHIPVAEFTWEDGTIVGS